MHFAIFTYMDKLKLILILCCFIATGAVFGQTEELAKNYFEQGEYEKALKTYEKLYEKAHGNTNYFYGIISSLQEMEKFSKAEKLLLEKLNATANSPALLIEVGHNYELKGEKDNARKFYEEALKAIEVRPNYAYMIARTFQKYTLLEEAIAAYEAGMEMNEDVNYHIQLARLYGELGQVEKMFSSYLSLLEANPNYFNIVNRYFSQFLTEDPANEANLIFRKLLLQKLQATQDIQFNEMLSWLFVQQKEYKKAFLQEKAIYRRSQQSLNNIINLAVISRKEKDVQTALEILEFVISETNSEDTKLQAHQELLNIKVENASKADYEQIEKDYLNLFQTYGYSDNTISLQIDYANFLAFKKNQNEAAIELLGNQLNNVVDKFKEAAIKMALADVLVMDNKFNQALIYYSQVQNLVKNDVISQNARFKVAKTSYYKGDFEWAKTQLDVLKTSTSQLIANDAMELSLLISDNSLEDSTQTALKKFAKADLLIFQGKETDAVALLEKILEDHKGEKIIDEALLRLGNIFSKQKIYTKAEAAYQKIITEYKNDILADDALYALADLYEHHLNQPEKAKENYEQIIFNHSDSIYFVDAQKNYRQLRGDAIK